MFSGNAEPKDIVVTPRRKTAGTTTEFSETSFEMQCVNSLVQFYLRQFPGAKVPKTVKEKNDWCVHVERMKRLDGRSEADIQEALQFAITDPFWQTNIRSAKKLREKFEVLILQSRRKKKSVTTNKTKNRFHNLEEHGYDYEEMVWEGINGGDNHGDSSRRDKAGEEADPNRPQG